MTRNRSSHPRLMVITAQWWHSAARISISLAKSGFQVAAVSPRGSLVRQTKAVQSHFVYRWWAGPNSIARAIAAWSPDFLVCADDQAVSDLHRLHDEASRDIKNGDPALVKLIEASLGDASSFAPARKKSRFIVDAQSVGVRCPKTIIVPDDHKIEPIFPTVSYPIVVKADGSWGGMGVRFASNETEARTAIRDLATPLSRPNRIMRLFGGRIRLSMVGQLPQRRQTVGLQEYISGRPANRAVVCWKGKVLAGISVEAVQTLYRFGPATVVHVINQPEMAEAAETLVKHFKLSGFVGFDFLLDDENRAWLLEMNPRVTPICHLSIADNEDLSAALYSEMIGASPIISTCPIKDKSIALFPQELMRSLRSNHLLAHYHDVPWEEPKLVRASLDTALRGRGILNRFRSRLQALSNIRARVLQPPVTKSKMRYSDATSNTVDVVHDRTSNLDLSTIVVSFNTREMTLECLRSVIAQTKDTSYEIIVVDNGSDDGSADAIEAEFLNIRVIRSIENMGFGRANNLAAKEARGRRLLLLNPDTVTLDRAIDRLVAFADENPSCRIWGGRTLWGDGSLNPMSCWRRMGVWNLFCFAFGLSYVAPNSAILNSESYGGWDRGTVRHVDIVTGCLFLIDRNLWEQLEGFDPAFFMYAEEADLCLRARKVGAHPIITPSATIVHFGGASEQSRADKLVKVFKGKATIFYRHWSPFRRVLGRALMMAAPLTRWWSYWLAARLSGQRNLDLVADEWRMVWLRRSEWISGYPLVSCEKIVD